jgi:predicted permease
MEQFLRDVRFAFRGLRKTPLFTTIAIASLALGIGANTAIFSLFDQVLVRSLGVSQPDRLVWFKATGPNMGFVLGPNSFSYPMYRDFAERNTVFDGVIGRFPTPLSMTHGGSTERVDGELITGNFFNVLGVQAFAGRLLTPDDDRTPGAHPVAVLSHAFWTRRFGGKTDIIDKNISLNGTPMTVVGVAPPGFHGVEVGVSPDVFVPTMMKAQMTPTWNELHNRRAMWLLVMARLKPDVSREQAEAAMNALWRPILQDELRAMQQAPERFRQRFATKHLSLAPGNQGVTTLQQTFSKPLRILLAMVGLVLLIACANVANLLLARGAMRQQELAIRLALGAGRGRLVRQFIVESLILALFGGALGIVVASWFTAGLLQLLPADAGLVRSFSTTPDLRVLAFTFGVAVLTAIVFGVGPAMQSTKLAVATTLKDRGTAVVGGSAVSWRRWLVAAQVSLSLVLLVGAGLFVRSLRNLTTQNVGFSTERLLVFSLDPKLSGYSQQQTVDLFTRVRDRVAALPGVRGATMSENSLMTDSVSVMTMSIEGYEPKEGEDMNPDVGRIGPAFFTTMGARVISGREFDERDLGDRVAMINEEMARVHFAGSNPLERRIRSPRGEWHRIVGVVSNLKNRGLRDQATRQVYFPYGSTERELGSMTFYVRTSQEPLSLARAVRTVVQDANVPVFSVNTMEGQMAENVYVDRIIAALSIAFGALATVLAGVGLYGVIAYLVSRRTREIGIRMALGAAWSQVLRVVFTEVALTVGVGLVVATGASLGLAKFVESQLYGVPARDPWTLIGAVAGLLIVVLIASVGPAIRALRIEPMRALRYE